MGQRLVVIGGDAAGMTGATNARRANSDLEIVVLERGRNTSYSACGIPYLVGGSVKELDDLVVRTPQEFRDHHRIDVRIGHEVTGIDLGARTVEVRALDQGGRTFRLGFDLLHIATGARPRRPDVEGIDEPWVHGVQTLDDAARLLAAVEAHECREVVVVGGGYIGVEMAEAFVDRGARVTVVEAGPAPMKALDADLGHEVTRALQRVGVDVRCGVRATGFADHIVSTTGGDLRADLVVLGLGVRPGSELAEAAGVALGHSGAIAVDHRQRTSVEGVFAAGDCADTFHLVTRDRTYVALGTVANKTGRVAGVNLGGGYASFPGVVGTAVTRAASIEVAVTGLNQAQARQAGIEVDVATAKATSRAHYIADSSPVTARVLVERGSGRLVGAQVVGGDRVGKRIDTMATAITAQMTATSFMDLDLAYAPAVSPLWDVFQQAARTIL